MALVPTLAPDPGADLAAQAQLMRQQKLAQLLANPPAAPEIDMGGDGGGKGDKGNSPEGNSILAKALSEDVAKTAGPSVASFDAPVSTGSNTGGLNIAGLGSAFPLISKFEGFRSKPYWDVNHYRVGFGSDTITTPDGQIVEVKPGMSVSRSDAERDLNRRIGEFQGGIQNDIGKDAWERLPEGTKAALTSVAYNYGAGWGRKIPALLTAARAGDVNAIAEAIASRKGDNQGVNAKRRLMESQIALGGAIPPYQAPAAAEAPYKVASLGFQPPPRTQPIAPMQPAPAPAPAPTATPPVPPIPTMVGAPMPTTSTPISPTAGASLTDAPLPPSRSASGVDDMIKRQAAAARPALSEPEGFDLFDEIGRGLEELFGGGGDTGGGGPSPQQLGTQLASAGEEYYPMPPSNSHGILGLISDAFREPVPIPQEVRALANSPKQSDRLAYQLMVHGDQLGGTQSAMLTALYKEAREREQAQQNRLGEPFRDQYGNLVQIGPNGEYNIRQAAEKPQGPISVSQGTTLYDPTTRQPIYTAPKEPPQPPASVQEYEYVKQHPEAAGYFTKTRVPDTENTAEIKNFKYAQQNPEFAKSLQRGPSLTPEAITFYGEQVARGDMSPLQNLGRGAQGAENVTAIRNAAVAFAQKNGMDPRAIMDASAGYLGEKAGARTLGTNEANAVNAGVEAMNALQLGRETNAKLPRGQFYPVNKAIQAYQFGTSDPNLAAYGQAVATIANTYARAVNPKGLPHEAVVSDTLRRLNAAQGPDALNAIFDIMQKEIEMAQRAPSQARDVLKGNREGTKAPSGKTSSGIPWTVEE